MSPIVVSREEFERLQKVIDKTPNKYNNYNARPITKRYLFLRYTIDGGKPRAKRIEIREHFGNVVWSWKMSEIAQHKSSKLLRKSKRQGFAIALVDPGHLEPLLRSALDTLGADSNELEYHWDEEFE